ncbi:MAG: potassium-transporting ATPase subunit C [Solirubrobacteraceae bacterium]
MKLAKELSTAAIAILVLTVMLGVAYPLVMTGISQVAFPNKADGSQIEADGKLVGSRLIAKPFVIDTGKKDADGNAITRPDPRYFQPRPSQTDYSATASAFSNRGPNSAVGRFFFRDQLNAYLALEGRYDPGLTKAKVPVDAVTTSASGVDPHISQANARIQAHRIAAVRRIPLDRVDKLIADNTDGRFLGVIGEPGVNVLELNLALDKEAPAR